MATCFGPLPPTSRRPFEINYPTGRPPRKDLSRRPPRVQRTRPHVCSNVNIDEVHAKRFQSSTYLSFRESYEDEISLESNSRRCKSARCRRRNQAFRNLENLDVFSVEEETKNRKSRRERWKTIDGYYSDTTVLPKKSKPFLSTFKSDDNDFENALLSTIKEKSKSTQNLSETKKNLISPKLKPVPIPSAEEVMPKLDRKRSVTFSEDSAKESKRTKYSVLRTELPNVTFEELKKSANTLHPKSLYSTTRYQNLHLTVFYGNECINPPIRVDEHLNDDSEKPRFMNHTSSSLRRQKMAANRNSFRGKLFRSQSEGNLAKNDAKSDNPNGNGSFNRYLRVLSGSWRNLLNRKFYFLIRKEPVVWFIGILIGGEKSSKMYNL